MQLRIMSLNIRNSRNSREKDGQNHWGNRKSLVSEVLHKYSPDLIGFQEVLIEQLHNLCVMLPDYQYVGVGREDGKEEGEFNPIFYKNFTVEQSDTFWLSDTPPIPSCTWGGQTRICTWAVMSAPLCLAFLNTHIEYAVLQAQLSSMDLLINTAQTYADRMPIILTGDFNYLPGSQPYQVLSAYMRDSYQEDPHNTADRFVSYHNFTGTTTVNANPDIGRIDYIWLKGDLQAAQSRILFDRPGNLPDVYPSDHWPVLCDVSFNL